MPYIGVVALFDRCAESPNSWVIKSDVEAQLGISAIQLRNEFAASEQADQAAVRQDHLADPVEEGTGQLLLPDGRHAGAVVARLPGGQMIHRQVCPFHSDEDVSGSPIGNDGSYVFVCELTRGHPGPGPYSWIQSP